MKRKNVRSTILTVIAAMMVFTIAACSGGNTNNTTSTTTTPETNNTNTNNSQVETEAAIGLQPEEGATLLIWEGQEQRAYMEQVMSEFNKLYPGVSFEYAEEGGEGSVEKMITDAPAGVGADVFVAGHDNLGRAVSAGIVLNVSAEYPEIAAAVASEHVESSIQASTYEGQQYGFPKSLETIALYYNKDLMPEAPQTFQDLIDFSQTWNDPTQNKFTWMNEVANGWWAYGFLASHGGYIFGNGNDINDLGLNNEGAVKGVTFLQSLSSEFLPLKSTDIVPDIKKSLFVEGKLVTNVSGPWDVKDVRDSGMNFGVAPMPAMPDGTPFVTFSNVKSYYVNEFTQYPNAAVLFAQFASGKEMQLLNFVETGALPSHVEVAEMEEVTSDEIVSGFVKQFENTVPTPNIPQMSTYWDAVGSALATIYNDGADVQASLDRAVEQMRDAMALIE